MKDDNLSHLHREIAIKQEILSHLGQEEYLVLTGERDLRRAVQGSIEGLIRELKTLPITPLPLFGETEIEESSLIEKIYALDEKIEEKESLIASLEGMIAAGLSTQPARNTPKIPLLYTIDYPEEVN